MAKSTKPKIYKATKKTLDGKDFVCVQVKNLKSSQIRDIKRDVNNLLEDWLEPKVEEFSASAEYHSHPAPDEY